MMMKADLVDIAHGSNVTTEIWASNVELPQLFSGEGCLPEIGSSQVSSILSTLDDPEKPLPIDDPSNIVLKVPNVTKRKRVVNKTKPTKKTKVLQDITIGCKDLTYILCELCPFLCLGEKKIVQHIDLVHKNKKPSEVFELKCPVCTNIFYHKLSLQAHLTYDHCVTNTNDVSNIIQIILHSKKSSIYTNKFPLVIDIEKAPIIIEGVKMMDDGKSDISVLAGLEEDSIQNNNEIDDGISNEVPPIEENTGEKMYTLIKNQNGVAVKSTNEYKLHKCQMKSCKIRMQSLELLKYHTECHHNNDYKCKECGDFFSSWKTLAGHLWRSHNVDMELFRCDQCEFRTPSLSRLNNMHKLIHGTTKGYMCDVCDKGFKNAKQLRNHKGTHRKLDSSNYKCKECDKSFSNRQQLKKHMDGIHKKLKPFLCNYCGYKGATRSGLQMHVRQHTGEKPFQCSLCDYSTADHNSLRRHKLRHSGEKPYKCSHCDYECIQTSTYKAHIKTKHPGLDKELLFSCSVCQFRSINKEVYSLHVASQHPELLKS